jgi:hypothetical protein
MEMLKLCFRFITIGVALFFASPQSNAVQAYTITEIVDSSRLSSVEVTANHKLVCTFKTKKSITKKIPTSIHARIMKEISETKPKSSYCAGQRRYFEHRDQKSKVIVVCDNDADSFLIAKLSDLCQLPEPQ